MPPEPARVLAAPFRFAAAGVAGMINGNRPAALPAAMSVMMVRCCGTATAGGTTETRGGALGADDMLVVLFIGGLAPSGRAEPGPDAPAERVAEAPADGVRDAERAGLALEEADRVGVGLRLGDGDAECVGLVLDEGDGDAECVGLALAVGDGDAECVGLALAVGDGAADADVDGDVDGDADVVAADGEADIDGDDEPVADGDGELAAGAAAFASACSCTPTDSPQTSKPPAARLATARLCAKPV